MERRSSMLLNAIKEISPRRVLELGCGSGKYTERFALPGIFLVGVELSNDLLKIHSCKKRGGRVFSPSFFSHIRFVLGKVFIYSVIAFNLVIPFPFLLLPVILFIAIYTSLHLTREYRPLDIAFNVAKKIFFITGYIYYGALVFLFIWSFEWYSSLIAIGIPLLIVLSRELPASRGKSGLLLFFHWLTMGIYVKGNDLNLAWILFLLFTILVPTLGLFSRPFINRLNRHTLFLWLTASLVIPMVSKFYFGIQEGEYRVIEKQRGVRTIFGHGRDEKADKLVGRHIRFAVESCDGENILIGSMELKRRDKPFLLYLDGEGKVVQKGNDVLATNYNAAFDCGRGVIYVIAYDYRQIWVFKEDDIKSPVKKFDINNKGPWMVFLMNDGDTLFVGDGFGMFELLDTHDGGLVYRMDMGGDLSWFTIPVIDDGIVLYRQKGLRRGNLEVYRFDNRTRSLNLTKRLDLSRKRDGQESQGDLNNKMYFLVEPVFGRVHVVDFSKGILRDGITLERGIRFYRYDNKRNFLYVGGYIKGNMYIVDLNKMKVLKRLYMGRRIRWLSLSRDGNRIMAGSAAGAFEIDIEEALKEVESRK